MITAAERIDQYAFEQRLLNDSFTNLVLNNKEKKAKIYTALAKHYGSSDIADMIINAA